MITITTLEEYYAANNNNKQAKPVKQEKQDYKEVSSNTSVLSKAYTMLVGSHVDVYR